MGPPQRPRARQLSPDLVDDQPERVVSTAAGPVIQPPEMPLRELPSQAPEGTPIALIEQRHEVIGDVTRAVAANLPSQPGVVAAMTVPDIRARFVPHRIAGLEGAVEEIRVLAAAGRAAGAEALVEQPDGRVAENLGAERGIGGGAELPGRHGVVAKSSEPRGGEVGARKPAAEPAVGLEQALRRSGEFDRQDIAGHDHHVGAVERRDQPLDPVGRGNHVVVGHDDDRAMAGQDAGVACVREAPSFFAHQHDAGKVSHHRRGHARSGVIVDDDDFDRP